MVNGTKADVPGEGVQFSNQRVFQEIRSFSELPAFELLSAAGCRQYFGGVSEALDGLTVSELAEMSERELEALALPVSDRKVIVTQLSGLAGAKLDVESEIPSPESDGERGARAPRGMTLSSVAQEQMLTDLLSELSGWPGLTVHGSKTLAECWTARHVRAPFEELLTLKQLSKMSVRSLLAKRSMTGEKITAIIEAVRNAMTLLPAATSKGAGQANASKDLAASQEESLTKRLLDAALRELTPEQRARVLMSVAGIEPGSPKRLPARAGKSSRKRQAAKGSRMKKQAHRKQTKRKRR